MEIKVELVEGEEVIIKCPRCDGVGEIENIFRGGYLRCPLCDGEGKINAELAEDQITYTSICEDDLLSNIPQ